MSINVDKLPHNVRESLTNRGHSPEHIKQMSAEEVFNEHCNWHGLINWGDSLRYALDNIRKAERKNRKVL